MTKRKLDVRTIKKKMKETGRHVLYKYEQDYLRKKTRDRLDIIAQRLPRLIATDGGKKKAKCFTCDNICTYKQLQGCHGIARGHYKCRREERNIYACCVGCNNSSMNSEKNQDHINTLTETIIDKMGRETYRSCRYDAGNKPTYDEMIKKMEYYKKRYKKLGFHKFL